MSKPWLTVAAAVLLAIPFGWGLGVLAAYVVAGKEFGQLPMATVPLGIIGSIAFALWPSIRAGTRLAVMAAGCAAFILLGWLLA